MEPVTVASKAQINDLKPGINKLVWIEGEYRTHLTVADGRLHKYSQVTGCRIALEDGSTRTVQVSKNVLYSARCDPKIARQPLRLNDKVKIWTRVEFVENPNNDSADVVFIAVVPIAVAAE